MSIFYYSKECGSCHQPEEIALMKSYCQEKGVDFSERRTLFWDRFEKEANDISKAYNVELPFFYSSNNKEVAKPETMKNIEKLKEFIEREKNAS